MGYKKFHFTLRLNDKTSILCHASEKMHTCVHHATFNSELKPIHLKPAFKFLQK